VGLGFTQELFDDTAGDAAAPQALTPAEAADSSSPLT
jgi:hypothetical protein